MESDYFLNLRDIAIYSKHKIKANMIYRSSDLSAYANDPVLYQWFHEKGIKTIIDLRNRKEILRRSYPREILKVINYRNDKLVSDETDERIQGRNRVEFYKWVLENEGERIREVLEILIDEDNYPLVIHCLVGMDRTGIIIALIH
ncbi:MAG: tyrosine-protein phosphatase, partial [Candidatus Hodarchaeales archaeon]